MDADARRIRELERGFRRDGLPNLIVDLSATEDIFTRAVPFLTLVFVVEAVNALDVNAGRANLLLGLGGVVVLLGGFGLLNVVRGRRFLSIPHRVGIPELVVFVTLPALLPVLFSGQFLFGFTTILANLAILVLTYVVVGFGLVFIVWWVVVRLFALLGASVAVLVRAVPLLVFFSLVSFFTPRSGRCSRRPAWRPTGRRSPCSCSSARAFSSCACRASSARCRRSRTWATCRFAVASG